MLVVLAPVTMLKEMSLATVAVFVGPINYPRQKGGSYLTALPVSIQRIVPVPLKSSSTQSNEMRVISTSVNLQSVSFKLHRRFLVC